MVTIAGMYGTHPISDRSTVSVPRVYGQLLAGMAVRHRQWRVVGVCPPGASIPGVDVIEVGFSDIERASLRILTNRMARRAVPSRTRFVAKDFWARKAIRAMGPSGADVVICANATTVVQVRERMCGSRIVFWMHMAPYRGDEDLLLRALGCADEVVVPSRALYEAVWDIARRDQFLPPVWVIPHWIDHDLFAPSPADKREETRGKLGVEADDVVIVHVGRAPFKGIHIVERALDGERPVDGKVVLASAGGRATGRRPVREGVELVELGRLAPEALARVYGASDLGVVPSVWFEGFGLVVAEMMSAGLAVVVSASGGPSELVEHDVTGLVVDLPNDVEAWGDALRRLGNHPELRARLGDGARVSIRDKLDRSVALETWDRVLDVERRGP